MEIERRPGGLLIRIRACWEGDLHRLGARLEELAEPGIIVVVELTEMVDNPGTELGVVIGALSRVRRRGADVRVVIYQSPRVRRIFEITGLTKVFAFYADVDAAFQGRAVVPC